MTYQEEKNYSIDEFASPHLDGIQVLVSTLHKSVLSVLAFVG